MNAVAAPATRPAAALGRARPSFPGAIRSELLKLGRTGLTWWLIGGALLITAITFISVAASDQFRQTLEQRPLSFYFTYLGAVTSVFTTVSGIFLLISGSRLVSMEYGSGTIRVVLARGTSRLGLLAAQYATLAIAGVLLFVGFAVIAAAFLYGLVVVWHGSFSPITSLPQVAWTDTWLCVIVAGISVATCILLGVAAAAVGRSVAFGIGVAMGFFPADNFGVVVMMLLGRLTHQNFWPKLTQYFLGPTLNDLPRALQTDHTVLTGFAAPLLQNLTTTHELVVIGVYMFVFLAAAVVLTWRRDVLH